MYIDHIELTNFRTFREARVDLIHPDKDFARLGLPRPALSNINLLLGDNGAGKTALLKAVALAGLGPAVGKVGLYPEHLVRRGGRARQARVAARFTPHDQDRVGRHKVIESVVYVERKGDLEELRWGHKDEKRWHPIYQERSDAFFFVGYGATRRVEQPEELSGPRQKSSFARAQRVNSLFKEAYSLRPLNAWLPDYQRRNKGRYVQVAALIDRLAGEGHYRFTGELERGEYLFERDGLKVPFPALSDGYRAFLGWVGDLLYHVCMTCPPGRKLVENRGIVMVDEIDLHLHPLWQMTVLPTLARGLSNIQFIVTTHSPLVVSSLEWMNIIYMMSKDRRGTVAERLPTAVHGLDADQVLLSGFFGLESTRTDTRSRRMKELTLKARGGDAQAAHQLLAEMSRGTEAEARS